MGRMVSCQRQASPVKVESRSALVFFEQGRKEGRDAL
jgi:hypothetical protein